MKKILLILFIVLNVTVIEFGQEKSGDSLKVTVPVLQDTSKTVISDSTKNIIKKEFYSAVNFPGMIYKSQTENILYKESLNKTDYRYTGNYFSNIPFGFIQDLGSFGQPNQVLIYGNGFNNSTYLSDGVEITNRLTNSYDLNLFQSESIDRIEIIPLTEGFLYGSRNNPVAVNFISSDFHIIKPYTRMRFYQAANQEGMIDGIFNTTINRKLGIYFEVSNHSTDAYYKNTAYGSWLATTRFRYILSKEINLFAHYRYSNTNVQLNGGVDFTSIQNNYSADQIDQVLYDKFLAPINFTNRYQKTTNHDIQFGAVAEFLPGYKTKFTAYFQSSLNEFRQNESTNLSNQQSNVVSISDNNKYETTGLQLDQSYDSDFMKIRAIADYGQNRFSTPQYLNKYQINSFSLSAKASFNLLDGILIPSAFTKYLNYNKNSFNGFGTNVKINIGKEMSLFAGYSEYEKPPSDFNIAVDFNSPLKQKNRSMEFHANYKGDNLNFQAGFFVNDLTNSEYAVLIKDFSVTNSSGYNEYSYLDIKNNRLKGANIKFDFRIWKLMISSNTSYYFSKDDRKEFGIPQFTSIGGIYYIDTLFNRNLKLKTGLNYWSIGSRYNVSYDFENNLAATYNWYLASNVRSVPFIPAEEYNPNFQLDFFLAGQIQDNAIIYFTFENLLGTNYYIIPYYPMRQRAMRFGVAWEFFD